MNIPQNKDQWMATEFIHLCNAMDRLSNEHLNPVINPLQFVRTVQIVAHHKGRDIFTGWAQNDLSEFLLFIIDCMHNSKQRKIQVRINGDSINATDDLAIQCYTMLKNSYERGEYSEFVDLFYGVYVSRLFTPDKSILHSNKPESYCLLDLPIPTKLPYSLTETSDARGVQLIDCFDAFVADELLTDWDNEKTGQKEHVRKNIAFWNLPKILVITLKRYSPDGRYKNEAFVDFPIQSLDLSKYVVGYRPNSYRYALFGVANHMGGVNGGHYTAYARLADSRVRENKWYCYNDSSVTEISQEEQIVSSSAYCLFYKRI